MSIRTVHQSKPDPCQAKGIALIGQYLCGCQAEGGAPKARDSHVVGLGAKEDSKLIHRTM